MHNNMQENTFQAILITDGTYSYTIFTYQCGLMEWDNGATIGFNAAGEIFANHNPSTADIACLNSPDTDWSNVVFLLSTNTSEPPPPCKSFSIIPLLKFESFLLTPFLSIFCCFYICT